MTNYEQWLRLTQSVNTDQHFIDGAYYFMISAALQRRVWLPGKANRHLYPAMYMILTGDPAMGKTAVIVLAKNILKKFISNGKVIALPKEEDFENLSVMIEKQRRDLEDAMHELSMVALQSDLEERTPEIESPIEVAPEMAADIAELMEGVDLDAPVESLPSEEDEFQTFAKKKGQNVLPGEERYSVCLVQRGISKYKTDVGVEELEDPVFTTDDYSEAKNMANEISRDEHINVAVFDTVENRIPWLSYSFSGSELDES